MAGNGTLYSAKIREQALELSDEIGTPNAAKQMHLKPNTIYYWRKVRERQEEKRQKAKMSQVVAPTDLKEEIKDNPHITFQSADDPERELKRGEIYYILKGGTTGSELANGSGRPAVIVSNNALNKILHTVEVVYLTTQVKRLSPEYTTLKATGVMATTICNQITTVDKSRVKEFAGECTPEEMNKIEKALLYSLGLGKFDTELMSDDQIIARMTTLKSERDVYKDMYNRLFEKLTQK